MTDQTSKTQVPYGVHSEVGTLRKVLVCSPGLAHTRLTPTNCDELLFDDVMWVQNAKRDHFDFIAKMRERGVEVVELHELLTETLEQPAARKWLLDRQIVANEVGAGLVADTRAFLESLAAKTLAEFMIGGLSTVDLPERHRFGYLALVREASGIGEYLLPTLPNTLYFVHPGHHVLDLGRGDAESPLLRGPARRDAAHRSDLQVPSELRERGDRGLVGQSGRALRRRDARRR